MPDIIDENAINIYTDGSSYSGPRRGGMGIVYVTVDDEGHEVVEDHQPQGYRSATNNQMELEACVKALDHLMRGRTKIELQKFRKIIVKTDSMYVTDNYPRARNEWSRNRWRNRNGRPVDNASQWKQLLREAVRTGKHVEFRWVKGHKDSAHNRAADSLAKKSAKGPPKSPLTVASVRRKRSTESVEPGSVKMLGQELTIRIVTDTLLQPQRVWKYKYEVTLASSPFAGKVDFACSDRDLLLRAGHEYRVVFNEDQANPWIVECREEVTASRDPDDE